MVDTEQLPMVTGSRSIPPSVTALDSENSGRFRNEETKSSEWVSEWMFLLCSTIQNGSGFKAGGAIRKLAQSVSKLSQWLVFCQERQLVRFSYEVDIVAELGDLLTAWLRRLWIPQASSQQTTFDLNRSFIHKGTQEICIPGKNIHRNTVNMISQLPTQSNCVLECKWIGQETGKIGERLVSGGVLIITISSLLLRLEDRGVIWHWSTVD